MRSTNFRRKKRIVLTRYYFEPIKEIGLTLGGGVESLADTFLGIFDSSEKRLAGFSCQCYVASQSARPSRVQEQDRELDRQPFSRHLCAPSGVSTAVGLHIPSLTSLSSYRWHSTVMTTLKIATRLTSRDDMSLRRFSRFRMSARESTYDARAGRTNTELLKPSLVLPRPYSFNLR
jgi:hypothetical protein